MVQITTTQKVGDIVTLMPKASDVFKQYNIDFCCGGDRPLGDVLKEQGLNEQEVLLALEKAFEETKAVTNQVDFKNMKYSALIDYIINTHHVLVRRLLPEISAYTTKIMSVHGANHDELFKVHTLFHTLKMELEQHLIKEEEILFPLIKEYEENPSDELMTRIQKVMKETEDEHDTAGDVLKELRKITNNYTVPQDGCNTYLVTFDKLQELESDLFQHIHLENNILFRNFK